MSWRVVYDALSDAFEKKQNEESLDRIRKKLKRIFFGGFDSRRDFSHKQAKVFDSNRIWLNKRKEEDKVTHMRE